MKHVLLHVKKEVWDKHLFDYLLIGTAAVFFVLAVKIFAGMMQMQVFLFMAFTVFYICWGIYHHIVTKTLRLKILLEYMLIGVAILFVALTLALY